MGFSHLRGSGVGSPEAGDSEAPVWAGDEVGGLERWERSWEVGEEAVGCGGGRSNQGWLLVLCLLKPMGEFVLLN